MYPIAWLCSITDRKCKRYFATVPSGVYSPAAARRAVAWLRQRRSRAIQPRWTEILVDSFSEHFPKLAYDGKQEVREANIIDIDIF